MATPLAWYEVRPGLTPTQFHIGNAVRRFERVGDLFEGVLKKPQKLDALPQDYVDKLMKGVVGFEMSVDKVEARFKLSQNKDNVDYENVMRELKALDDYNAKWVAGEMERRKT